jgi:hypothetical protein
MPHAILWLTEGLGGESHVRSLSRDWFSVELLQHVQQNDSNIGESQTFYLGHCSSGNVCNLQGSHHRHQIFLLGERIQLQNRILDFRPTH